jgi:hypothetical protein
MQESPSPGAGDHKLSLCIVSLCIVEDAHKLIKSEKGDRSAAVLADEVVHGLAAGLAVVLGLLLKAAPAKHGTGSGKARE